MTSSTLHSKGKSVRFLACLGIGVLITFLFCIWYTLRWNPEVRFWGPFVDQKLEWTRTLQSTHDMVIGVIGGSSTTFGVDADYLFRKHGLPVANLGLHAGMGAEFLVGIGIKTLRSGDILIVSLEPALFCESADRPALGTQMAARLERMDMLNWRSHTAGLPALASALPDLRPGGYHTFTMLGKVLMGMPGYRYTLENSRPGGLQVTQERRPMPLWDSAPVMKLSQDGELLLRDIKKHADAEGIRVVYLLPWNYAAKSVVSDVRRENAAFIKVVATIIPVLEEPEMGAISDESLFADSAQHLTEEGARIRTGRLATALQAFIESN